MRSAITNLLIPFAGRYEFKNQESELTKQREEMHSKRREMPIKLLIPSRIVQ